MDRNSHFGIEFPVISTSDFWGDRLVCQGHADYCAEYGHATHTVDGVVSPYCPRCGDDLDRVKVFFDSQVFIVFVLKRGPVVAMVITTDGNRGMVTIAELENWNTTEVVPRYTIEAFGNRYAFDTLDEAKAVTAEYFDITGTILEIRKIAA